MRTMWSVEDFLAEIPVAEGFDIDSTKILNYGVSNYVYHIMDQEEDAYLACLKKIENAGFEKYTENTIGFKGHFYSTTYEKGDVVVTVTHFKTGKRLSVSGCLNLYRNNRSAEEVFENIPVLDGTVEHRGDGT